MLLPLQLNNLLPPPEGALSGSSSITFGSSAAPTLSVTASSSITFADSALLGGTFPLTGSSSITFAPTSTLSDASAVVEATPQRGGRSRRKGRRYVVEIDGQYFPVANISDAEALLMQARQMAEEAAPRDVGKATVRIKPPRVAIKTASGAETTSVTLKREVKRTQEIINKIYRDAYESIERTREISRLLHKKLEEEDEEEAILALLM